MERLIELQTLSKEAAQFLEMLVKAGYNIFISGGTGSGKTTFLNALSGCIPSGERIITIEDSAELQLHGIENLIRLETRCANVKGMEEITIRDLIRAALRMRPDRIIVGECRGAEALDMLQAMNTGHDGSLSTGHANSCEDIDGNGIAANGDPGADCIRCGYFSPCGADAGWFKKTPKHYGSWSIYGWQDRVISIVGVSGKG